MKLKEKILVKAIELFNEKGISSTSPNQIAEALEISTGNLTYHFKTKATLIKKIYERMDNETKDLIQINDYLTLNEFRVIMSGFRDFMQKHRFFFQDLFYIIQNFPEVGKLYEASNLFRLKKGKALFGHYIQTGRMIPECNGINYDYLAHNVWMVSAFWNLQSKIFHPGTLFHNQMDLVEMTWYMILPYLTETGKEEYEQINAFLKKQ